MLRYDNKLRFIAQVGLLSPHNTTASFSLCGKIKNLCTHSRTSSASSTSHAHWIILWDVVRRRMQFVGGQRACATKEAEVEWIAAQGESRDAIYATTNSFRRNSAGPATATAIAGSFARWQKSMMIVRSVASASRHSGHRQLLDPSRRMLTT